MRRTAALAALDAPFADGSLRRIGAELRNSDVLALGLALVAFLISLPLGAAGLLLIWLPTALWFVAAPSVGVAWAIPAIFAQTAVSRIGGIAVPQYAWASRFDETLLLIAALAVGIRCLRARRMVMPPGIGFGVAFAISALVSTFSAGAPLAPAALGLALTLKVMVAYLIVAQVAISPADLRRFTTLVFVGGAVMLLVVLVQWAGLLTPWANYERFGEFAATSIFSQHTVFGSAAAMLAMFGASIALMSRRRRATGMALAAASGTAVILSAARRVLFTVPAGLIAMSMLTGRRMHIQLSRRQVLVGAFVTVILAVIVLPRFVALTEGLYTEYVVKAQVRDRYELYGTSFALLAERPLFGWGPGTFGSWAAVLSDSPLFKELPRRLSPGLLTGAPYASLLAEFGLIGSALYVGALLRIVHAMTKAVRTAGGAAVVGFAAGAALISLLLEQVVHPVLNDSFVGLLTFGAAGIALAMSAPAPEAPTTGAPRVW